MSDIICRSDLHIHTNLSLCAPRTTFVESYLPYFEKEGVKTAGISNHIHAPNKLNTVYPQNINHTLSVKNELEQIKDKTDVKFLVGCEIEYFYGQEPGLNREDCNKFDYVMIAASHIFNFPDEYAHMDLSTPKKVKDLIYEQFRRACMLEIDKPAAICHPLYPIACPFEQEVVDSMTDSELGDCFTLAREKNKSVEVHACLYRKKTYLDADGISPSYVRLLTIAKECGCKFFFGSDAHEPDAFIGVHEKLGLAARRAGITEYDLWEIAK